MGESACLTVGCFISLNKHLLRLYLCQPLCWGMFHWHVWKWVCIDLPQGTHVERLPWACLSPTTSPKQQVNGEKGWIINSKGVWLSGEKWRGLSQCFSNFAIHTIVKMQVIIQQIWAWIQDSAFLGVSQVIQMLLIWGQHLKWWKVYLIFMLLCYVSFCCVGR